MAGLEKITIQPGLTFDALVAGERGSPLVLLLHGSRRRAATISPPPPRRCFPAIDS
jgi:hypothetical protein